MQDLFFAWVAALPDGNIRHGVGHGLKFTMPTNKAKKACWNSGGIERRKQDQNAVQCNEYRAIAGACLRLHAILKMMEKQE